MLISVRLGQTCLDLFVQLSDKTRQHIIHKVKLWLFKFDNNDYHVLNVTSNLTQLRSSLYSQVT